MKTKKLIKNALEFPIIVATSLHHSPAEGRNDAYACSGIYITVRGVLASSTQETTEGGVTKQLGSI